MKTKRRVVVTVILSAILVAAVLFAQLWSQSFYDFAHLDRATQLYIHSARNIEEPIPQVILENQEFQPLVDVLGSATVRFDGRSRLPDGMQRKICMTCTSGTLRTTNLY